MDHAGSGICELVSIHTHAPRTASCKERENEKKKREAPERETWEGWGEEDMKLFASEWNVVWFKVLPVIWGWRSRVVFHSSNLRDLGPGFIPLRYSFKRCRSGARGTVLDLFLFLGFWYICLRGFVHEIPGCVGVEYVQLLPLAPGSYLELHCAFSFFACCEPEE